MARKRLGETTGAFWSDTELNSWIDEAGEDLAFKTKSIRTNSYFTSVVSTSDYVLSTELPNCLSIFELYFKTNGTTWVKMDPLTTRESLDIEYPGWMNASAGVPDRYYYNREEDKLFIFPKPNSSNAGANYVRAFYARTYTALTDDGLSPTLPEPLHLAMVDWVVSLGYETRGYGDKANDAMAKYEAKIQRYMVERHREKEDDDIQMRPERRWH